MRVSEIYVWLGHSCHVLVEEHIVCLGSLVTSLTREKEKNRFGKEGLGYKFKIWT